MAVREFLQITQESAYKVPVASPARGTNQIVIALTDGNAFTARPEPLAVDVPYGGGFAVTATSVSDKTQVQGTLRTPLCYSQAALLLGLGLSKINAGQTTPWVTTEPIGDLASVTIDHAVWQDDTNTYKRKRYLGVKCSGGSLECSEESQIATLNLNLIGSTPQGNTFDASSDPNSTVFPVPADTDYARDYVLFTHSGGNLYLGSLVTARTLYSSLKLGWTNKMDAHYFANRFVTTIRSLGRQVMLDADVMLVASPDDRATFETLGALAAQVAFNNGTHNFQLNYNANSRIKSLGDDLPLEKIFFRKFSLMNRYDPAAGGDVSFTTA